MRLVGRTNSCAPILRFGGSQNKLRYRLPRNAGMPGERFLTQRSASLPDWRPLILAVVRMHFWLTQPEESKSILFGSSAVCRDKLPELRLSTSSSSAAD